MLILLLLLPTLAVAAIMLGAPAKKTALIASVLNLLVSIVIAIQFVPAAPGYQFEQIFPWASLAGLPTIHFHIGIDGISLPLVLLSTVVTLAAVAVSPCDIARPAEFFSYVLLISLGVVGAFVSLDLFFLYIFHEFALIPTFLLIGIWGTQNRQFSAVQITLYLTLGSLILLAGLIALVLSLPLEARSFDLPVVQAAIAQASLSGHLENVIFGLLLIGSGILVSLFPFHTWAPSAYASAPPAAAMLHGGVLKKFGLYVLIRVAIPLLPGGAEHWHGWLIALLIGNILYVGLATLSQKELTTTLGYSSVMHMGYLFLGLVSWNEIGLSGVVFFMIAHGLSTALLFALAGEIQTRTGEIRLAELGGLAKRMPFIAVTFIIGAMAMAGLPGLANFVGEMLIFFGAWHSHPVVAVIAVWGIVLTPVFLLRSVSATFFGPLPEKFAAVTDLECGWGRAPYLFLLATLLVLGFAPGLLLAWIRPAVAQLIGVH